MPEFQRPRGTRDFGPEEMAKRRYVESKLRETARLFGFGEVSTPIFESTELFVEKSGEDIIEELYAFEDKGGRKIALRPHDVYAERFLVEQLCSNGFRFSGVVGDEDGGLLRWVFLSVVEPAVDV